jgi:hypothetical protein
MLMGLSLSLDTCVVEALVRSGTGTCADGVPGHSTEARYGQNHDQHHHHLTSDGADVHAALPEMPAFLFKE